MSIHFSTIKFFRKIAPKPNLSFNHLNHSFTQNRVTKLFFYRNTIQKRRASLFMSVLDLFEYNFKIFES